MPLPAYNSLTSFNATVSKLGQRQNRSSLVRQLFHRTSQAVAILTVMKKGKRTTAYKNKPVVIKTFHQWRKTPLSIAMGFAILILAPQVHADNKITNAGATFGVIKEKNWINTAGSADFYVYSILVSPEQRSGSTAAEYRSINVPSRASDDAIFYINLDDQHNQINPSNSSTVFDMTTSKFRNSQTDSDWTDVGPSIYNIVANWDPTQYGNKIDMSVGAVWLDVTKWESGYIYQEINDPDIFNGYGGGYGHIPGIINIVNRGCNIADTIKSVCRHADSSGRSPNAKGGNISMIVRGITNKNGDSQINVAGEIGYLTGQGGAVPGQGGAVPSVMSTSLPWRAAGASISLTANGGRAYGRMWDGYNSSGDGGDIDFEVSDYFFNVGAFTGLKTNDMAPYAVLSAVSRGGTNGSASLLSTARVLDKFELDNFVFQGDGGVVNVQVIDTEINSLQDTSYVIGIVAASLGGSSQQFPYWWDQPSGGMQPGVGGDVNVTFADYSLINLPYNNSIGIVAASTADTMILSDYDQTVLGITNHSKKYLSTPGDVTVTLGMYSEIIVGDKGLKANAVSHADTNIGVLAISSGGWARETFTGANLDYVMPNLVGNVTVLNAGNVTVYGPNASGVLVQSIGGGSISSPGLASVGGTSLDFTIEKHTSFSTSDGGNVTYSSTAESESGGFIKAQGDGATALLLQSIGGGGGAGGNATGLFVAVGGNGGEGGHGGSVDVTFTDQQIFAKGDYAKGVIAHSIGGGGGSGGHAKAFSLLSVLPSVGIGGSGGEGGNGGDLTFTAVLSSVTTAGQHAMGLTFQSIGGGGVLVAQCTTTARALVSRLKPGLVVQVVKVVRVARSRSR